MKKGILFILLAALGITVLFAQENKKPVKSSLEIGAGLPAIVQKFKGTDSKSYALNDVATKNGLIVMFSCNTCPYVIRSQQRTKEVMALAQRSGLGMVIVNSNTAQRDDADSYNEMVAYAKQQGYAVPYIVDDGELVDAFGATRTPEVFLFDGNKKLVYKGAMEDNPSQPSSSTHMYVHEAVGNMLAGKAPDPNSTKSIGCSIKR